MSPPPIVKELPSITVKGAERRPLDRSRRCPRVGSSRGWQRCTAGAGSSTDHGRGVHSGPCRVRAGPCPSARDGHDHCACARGGVATVAAQLPQFTIAATVYQVNPAADASLACLSCVAFRKPLLSQRLWSHWSWAGGRLRSCGTPCASRRHGLAGGPLTNTGKLQDTVARRHSVVAPILTAPLLTDTCRSTVGPGMREDIVTSLGCDRIASARGGVHHASSRSGCSNNGNGGAHRTVAHAAPAPFGIAAPALVV